MGSENQKGGGVGQQAVGQTQHPSRNCAFFCKGGQGQKKFCAIFFAEPIFAKGTKPKINFFCSFFLRQNNTLDRELIISANN